MTTKRIVFTRPDGGVTVIVPIPQPGETEAQTLARCSARAVPAGTPFVVLDETALPSRRWRNAWRLSGTTIMHHLPAAKAIRRGELLSERDTRLARVRHREQEAREDGQNALATQLRTRAVTLRQIEAQADTDLTALTDLAALAAYRPTAFSQED